MLRDQLWREGLRVGRRHVTTLMQRMSIMVITLEACHAKEIIEQAVAKYGVLEIVNTDQGSQFTAIGFTQAVLGKGCKLSMDGRGAWRDNVSSSGCGAA